jgi:hypothetical protein
LFTRLLGIAHLCGVEFVFVKVQRHPCKVLDDERVERSLQTDGVVFVDRQAAEKERVAAGRACPIRRRRAGT